MRKFATLLYTTLPIFCVGFLCLVLIFCKNSGFGEFNKDDHAPSSDSFSTSSEIPTSQFTPSNNNSDGSYKATLSLYESPFKVTGIYTNTDTAGGVDLIVSYNVGATSEIKYVYLYATPYNRVGDIESSQIGGKSTAVCRLIGPYNSNNSGSATFENVWYNYAISSARIDKIEIEFTNGNVFTYR